MLHIAIALVSLGVSIAGLAIVSRRLLHVSYGLIAATVLSGTALIFVDGVNMLHVCMSGLVYVTAATAMTLYAGRRVRRLAK